MTRINHAVDKSSLKDQPDCGYRQILRKKLATNQGFSQLDADGNRTAHNRKASHHSQQSQANIYCSNKSIDPDRQTFKALTSDFTAAGLGAPCNQPISRQRATAEFTPSKLLLTQPWQGQ